MLEYSATLLLMRRKNKVEVCVEERVFRLVQVDSLLEANRLMGEGMEIVSVVQVNGTVLFYLKTS